MPSKTPSEGRPFTIFRSAAEEAETKIAEKKEGRRMPSKALCVTHTKGAELPYKVVLNRSRGAAHRSFATMRDAEDFIRRVSPAPAPALSKLYDRPAPES